MANNLLTISMITREAIELFVNSNQFIKNIDRQYDSEFGKGNAKIGSQLRIRLPNDYVVRHGPAVSLQDTSEQQTVLTMATQDGVDVNFSTADLYLSLDDFSERILLPMMNNLAGDVAGTIMGNSAEAIANVIANKDGNNNILLPTSQTYLRAQAILMNNSAPMVNHKIINEPLQEADVVQSLSGLLNPASAISDQYYEGAMYKALGATWFSDQTVIKHTSGTFTTGTVSGAGQTGPTLTIAVAANGTSLALYPSLIPAVNGNAVQYQTVDVSPADGAVITPYFNASTTYNKSFRYAPQMVTMATGDLPLPANKVTARHKYDNVSMRSITDYMIGTDQEITRLDVLFGSLVPRGEWGCVVPAPVVNLQ